MRLRRKQGFSLIELVMLMALVAILIGIGVTMTGDTVDAQRYESTRKQLAAIRTALIGDDKVTGANGRRSQFGFMGDWGGPPTSLTGLTTDPGQPYAYDPAVGFGVGWRGPYLNTELSGVSLTSDAWGNALVYVAGPPTTVTSYGSDGTAGTTAGKIYSQDIVLTINADRWRGRVWGMVLNGATGLSGRTVQIKYPSGGIQVSTTTTTAGNGSFSFSNIPFGVRMLSVTAPETFTNKAPIVVDTSEYSIPKDALNFLNSDVNLHAACCRLTLDSANPIPSVDLTSQGTLFLVPYQGNVMPLWDGTTWKNYTVPAGGISIGTPGGTNRNFDVFVFDNGGTPALELVAWNTNTARNIALTTQNGIYVQSGDTTRRYVATIRTDGAGNFEDSASRRFVWNHHNRVPRPLLATYATASWTYATDSWRAANANTTVGQTRVEIVVGLAEALIDLTVRCRAYNSATNLHRISIDEDGTLGTNADIEGRNDSQNPHAMLLQAYLKKYPAIGRRFYQWVERSGGGTTTYFSSGMGITGNIEG